MWPLSSSLKNYLKNRMDRKGKGPGLWFQFSCICSKSSNFFSRAEPSVDVPARWPLAFPGATGLSEGEFLMASDRHKGHKKKRNDGMELLTKHTVGSRTCICTFSVHRKNLHLPSHTEVSTFSNYWEETEAVATSFYNGERTACALVDHNTF